MFKNLRIIFCILAVAGAAATIFVFVFAGWIWGTVVLAATFIFAALMFICKNKQISEEEPQEDVKEGDFITGRRKADGDGANGGETDGVKADGGAVKNGGEKEPEGEKTRGE